MHRLHRVRFLVARPHETSAGVWCSYSERCLLVEVTPATLEACRLDVEDTVKLFDGDVFGPDVLWHSHFRYRKGRLIHPRRPPRRQKDRARRRRELMLRDKQRILERCSTTAHD